MPASFVICHSSFIFLLFAFCSPLSAQTRNVQKTIATDALTETIKIGSGKKLEILSGGTIEAKAGSTVTGFGGGGGSSGITIDTSAITGGTVGNVLYHKTGDVVGEIATSTGGLGTDDYAKLVKFGANGELLSTGFMTVFPLAGTAQGILTSSSLYLSNDGVTSWFEITGTPTGQRTLNLGDTSGTIVNTGQTGTVTNTMLAGSIANAKLATNPLARANHTGTQSMSTISDAGALATLSAVTSSTITDGTIVNSDISASASIALSKLAASGNYTTTGTISATSGIGSPNLYTFDALGAFTFRFRYADDATDNRTLSISTADADRALTISGDATVSGTNTGDQSLNDLLPSQTGNSGKVLGTNGSTTSWVSAGSGITIGTTSITSGTSGRVLYDNSGTLGEMTTSGSGTELALTTSPTFTTPALGTPSAIVLTNATGSPTGISLTKSQLDTIISDDNAAYVGTANTFTAAQIVSVNGAASTPPLKINGTVFTGGSATTTTPQLLIEPSGTTSTSWSTSGTMLGINSASGFGGYLFDFKVNNSSVANLNTGGTLAAAHLTSSNEVNASNYTLAAGGYYASNSDTYLTRDAAATWQFGADAASAVAQTLKAHDGSGTDKAGASLTLEGGQSTGTGAGGDVITKTALTSTTGSSANSYSTRSYTRGKFVDLTESTATLFTNIALASSKYVGSRIIATVTANDGTDYQSLTSEISVDAVNKAGTVTATLTQVDNTTAASTGTLTCTYTAVANGNGVDIKANAVSSLTQTVLRVKYDIQTINSDDTATVTP